jgi:WD40 repeat protein
MHHLVSSQPLNSTPSSIEHIGPVKCINLVTSQTGELLYLIAGTGDNLYTWDIASFALGEDKADLLSNSECHADDITSISIWEEPDTANEPQLGKPETWVVTGSLDGTIRRWRLTGKVFLSNHISMP